MMKSVFFFALALLYSLTSRAENSAERTLRDFRQMGLTIASATSIKILPTAEEKFRDLFQDIEAAEHYIHLDYFKFQQDSICGALLERLYRKAAEGVDVRILFDSFGNRNSDLPLSDTLQQSIRARGVQIKAFDPVRFPWVNHLMHRNHHKIAVIDGRICYTGGMNVADYYLHGKPKVGRWRDMHVRLTGPIVKEYEGLFMRMWQKEEQGARGKEQENTKQSQVPPAILLPLVPCPLSLIQAPCPLSLVPLCFASRWPRESPAIMRQTYVRCIDNADRLVQIVNPYAMLFGEVRAALRRALERGVRVQFMVSSRSDSGLDDDVIGLEMRKLMRRGAEVYYYEDGFHHSKVMMIDSLFCTVGTTNLDARSLRFDYEVNAFIFSPQTTHELQAIFQRDIREASTLLTPEEWQRRFPPRRRIRSRFYTLAKRFL